MSLYDGLFRGVLRHLDPESAHHLATPVIRARALLPTPAVPADLAVHTLGLTFPTPFGIAAGFDKRGTMVEGLGALGFGHVEVGTVTAHAQPGNPTPRLFRLTDDRALVNRMGFNNDGAAAVAVRLQRVRDRARHPIIGVNIGKSRITPVEDAVQDYVRSTTSLAPLADYLAVNVSSPNTPGLRGLQEDTMLAPLLAAVRKAAGTTPLLVKIAPDLDDEQVEGIARRAVESGLDGIIATNTTVARAGLRSDAERVRSAGEGGLSGVPLAERAREVLRILRAHVPADMCLIGVGGIESASDVRERLADGATLVQGYTGFIYRGPEWASQINRGLVVGDAGE